MIAGAYDAFYDPYCYRNTAVLKNRAKLRDQEALDGFELEMSPLGAFDTAHYRAVHRHLFQDVYSWAGRYRTVRTAKEGNAFCYPEFIEANMEALFSRLQKTPFLGEAAAADFVAHAAISLRS